MSGWIILGICLSCLALLVIFACMRMAAIHDDGEDELADIARQIREREDQP